MCTDLESRRTDIALLANVYIKLNEVNRNLQGSKLCLIEANDIIMEFIDMIAIYKNRIASCNFYKFSCLQSLKENNFDYSFLLDVGVDHNSSYLQTLKEDMLKRLMN